MLFLLIFKIFDIFLIKKINNFRTYNFSITHLHIQTNNFSIILLFEQIIFLILAIQKYDLRKHLQTHYPFFINATHVPTGGVANRDKLGIL